MSSLADILGNGGIPELQAHPERFTDLREEMRALCKQGGLGLYFLGKAVMGWSDMTPRLHYPMCKFVSEPPSLFTLLMAFRGSLKSTIATVGATIQLQLQKPTEILIYSEGSTLAEDWSAQARKPFEGQNALFQWLFPELVVSGRPDKWGFPHWVLPHGGVVRAAGLDSSLMGVHPEHLFMDDIFSDPKGDKTAEFAQRVIQWVDMSKPLLRNPGKNHRRLVGVPWWVKGEPYAHFREKIPASSQFLMPFEDADGNETWPERGIDLSDVDPFVVASQYYLNPVTSETAVFQRGVVKLYDEKPQDRDFVRVMACDAAFTDNARSHYNAYSVADVDKKGNRWIEEAEKKKLDSAKAARWFVEKAMFYDVQWLGIEANGPQTVFYQLVERTLRQYPLHHKARSIRLVPLKPTRDKIARWNRLASGCATGEVRINAKLNHLVSEMYRVTGAKHEQNDLTDSAAHLVGPELATKKPMVYSSLKPDHALPHALQEDWTETRPSAGYMSA